MDWNCGLSSRVSALQVEALNSNSSHTKKKKPKNTAKTTAQTVLDRVTRREAEEVLTGAGLFDGTNF
jgi:hypothetical protein